jgi:4-aminobutyrate aminotransferase
MAARHKGIRAVRGAGLYFGVDVQDVAVADMVMYRCLAAGLSFKIGGGTVLTLCPPLTIDPADLVKAIDILDTALAAA